MATATAPEIENPKNVADVNSTPPASDASITSPLASSDGGGDESKDKAVQGPVRTNDEDGGGAVTDIQKKMKRAERFGMPVQLSEEEKRNSRAERFGTGTGTGPGTGTGTAMNGIDSSDPSEELKRKARAERFGIVQTEPSDEDAKKKARLARFGSSKPDPAEEEKKKARAIRFSQPVSGSNAGGKENSEVKTAITGKAGGGT